MNCRKIQKCCYVLAVKIVPSAVDVLRAGLKEINSVKLIIKDLVDIQASNGVYVGGPQWSVKTTHDMWNT